MNQSPKKYSKSLPVAVIAAIALGVSYYVYSHHNSTHAPAKSEAEMGQSDKQPLRKILFNSDQRAEIQQIFLDSIREKPDLFINAMNDGVQAQQDKLRIDMEKSATEKQKELLGSSVILGSPQANIRLLAFVDPLCPHCQNFKKIALTLLQKRQDVAFYLIPIAILGPNSAVLSKAIIAASKQGEVKFATFIQKLSDKKSGVDVGKLPQLAKEALLDTTQFEKDINSDDIQKQLLSNTTLAEALKIPGVPTIFGVQNNGTLSIVPPMDINGFNQVLDNIKTDKPITEGFNPVKGNTDES